MIAARRLTLLDLARSISCGADIFSAAHTGTMRQNTVAILHMAQILYSNCVRSIDDLVRVLGRNCLYWQQHGLGEQLSLDVKCDDGDRIRADFDSEIFPSLNL